MATSIRVQDAQSTREIKAYSMDFANELAEAESIASATVIHTPPSGTGSTITATVDDSQVIWNFGPLTTVGNHELYVLVVTSDGYKHEAKLIVPVYW